MGIFGKKKKGFFRKKSGLEKFWSKLSTKNKVGLIFFILVLVGAGSAFALSQTDQSLQSHASLECNSNCERACSRLKTESKTDQYNKCISNCEGKCDLVSDDASHQVCHSPFASRFYSLSASYKKKDNGKTLGTARMAWLSRVFSATNIDIKTETQFTNWFELNCQVEDPTVPPPPSCQPNWTQVLAKRVKVELKYAQGSNFAPPPTTGMTEPQYAWPDTCKGKPAKTGSSCSQRILPLSKTEVAQYKKWLAAGRPAITENLCGGGSTKAVIVPDISWETCISAKKYAIFKPYPTTCETIINDQVKVAVLGDEGYVGSTCKKPTCENAERLSITNAKYVTDSQCPIYACEVQRDPITWTQCLADGKSKILESYPSVCVHPNRQKVVNPNQRVTLPDEQVYCDTPDACGSNETCYFPPMEPCPTVGTACAQVMPRSYCVPQDQTSSRLQPGCYYQEVQCIQAPCEPILVCPDDDHLVDPELYETSTR